MCRTRDVPFATQIAQEKAGFPRGEFFRAKQFFPSVVFSPFSTSPFRSPLAKYFHNDIIFFRCRPMKTGKNDVIGEMFLQWRAKW